VEFEQGGEERAGYGEELLERLSRDLAGRLGRGFSRQNLQNMRQFYRAFPHVKICQTASGKSSRDAAMAICQTASGKLAGRDTFALMDLARVFPLSWSHYVILVSRSRSTEALEFYHTEALRGGWTVRQLARQIDSQFYERTALSRNKAAMLKKGQTARPDDAVTPDEEVKDPVVLEFCCYHGRRVAGLGRQLQAEVNQS
ncbi:MAG: DUF1016 N-terminal domain-containing protein, partial [Pseudomonadota bacterium]